jgi:hypothetical protein
MLQIIQVALSRGASSSKKAAKVSKCWHKHYKSLLWAYLELIIYGFTVHYAALVIHKWKKLSKVVPLQAPVVAQRVGRGIALLFYDHSARRGWVVSSTPRPYLTPGKDPVPIVQEAVWAPGLVWTGRKSRPTGIWSPDHPARSQSLYRLSYPAHGYS